MLPPTPFDKLQPSLDRATAGHSRTGEVDGEPEIKPYKDENMKSFKHTRAQSILSGNQANSVQFTLVELLVVISIIGLLAALSFPVLSHVQAKARMTKCVGNLHQIGVRLHTYADDYDGYMPVCKRIGDTPSDPMALQNIMPMPSSEIYLCPADTKKEFSGMTFYEKHGSSYEWNAWFNGSKLSGNSALTSLVGKLPVIWDSAKFHGKLGHNFLYPEGKVTTE